MVLKRKLPSAIAKDEDKKVEGAQKGASARTSAPSSKKPQSKPQQKVSFDEFADEVPSKAPPLAPEPTTEAKGSAIPESSSKLTEENTFQQRHIPENDFEVEKTAPEQPKPENKQSEQPAENALDSWAEEPATSSGWDLDDLDLTSNQEEDVFGSMAQEQQAQAPQVEPEKTTEKSDPLPPWQQGAVTGAAPELPAGTTFDNDTSKTGATPADIAARGAAALANHEKAKPFGALVGVLLLVGIGFAGYSFFVEKDETTEVISRWTGSLNEVSEEIPTTTDVASTSEKPALKPEAVVDMSALQNEKSTEPELMDVATSPESEEMGDLMVAEESPVMEDEIAPEMPISGEETANVSGDDGVDMTTKTQAENNTIVEFVDVPEDEVEKPIDAEGAPEMPEEVGVIVQLQQAIEQARQEKNPDDFKPKEELVEKAPEDELEMLSPAEIDARNKELSRQLEEELAEYRKILAGESNTVDAGYKPSPSEYFQEKEAESGSIPLPKRQSALLSQSQAESLYGANPYNLPVVPEPSYQQETGVRTLEEFDVAMFQVERERVRIPKNIRPSFRATNFPPLILLSTVPKKGIIAELNDKQGVLLIGESVSGWELLSVKQEYPEFSNGKRKHIVSIGR